MSCTQGNRAWNQVPMPVQTDTNSVGFVAARGSGLQEHCGRDSPGSPGLSRGCDSREPCATGAGADASEKQTAFSYYLPALLPAGMQDAAAYVLLLKSKVAYPLPSNSGEASSFSRYQMKGAPPLHRVSISPGCQVTGAQVLKSLTSLN